MTDSPWASRAGLRAEGVYPAPVAAIGRHDRLDPVGHDAVVPSAGCLPSPAPAEGQPGVAGVRDVVVLDCGRGHVAWGGKRC